MKELIQKLGHTKGDISDGFCDGIMNAVLHDFAQKKAQSQAGLKRDDLLEIDGENTAIESMLFLSQILNTLEIKDIVFVFDHIQSALKKKLDAKDIIEDFRPFFLYYYARSNDFETWKDLPSDEKIAYVRRDVSQSQNSKKFEKSLNLLDLKLMKLDENHLDKKNILQQRAAVLSQKELMEERIAKQVIYSYDTVRKYMNARSIIDTCFLFQDGLYSCANKDLDVERAEKETLYNLKPGELGKNRIKELVARDLNFELLGHRLPAAECMLLSVNFKKSKLKSIVDCIAGCGDDAIIRISTPSHVSGIAIKKDGIAYIINETSVDKTDTTNINLDQVLDGHDAGYNESGTPHIPLAHIQVRSVKGSMAKDVYDQFLTMQGEDIKEVECTKDNNDNLRMMGFDLECELAAKSFFEYTQECGNLKRSGANHPKLALINEFLKAAGVIVSKYRSYVDNSSYLENNKQRKGQKIAEIEQRFGTIEDPPYQPEKRRKITGQQDGKVSGETDEGHLHPNP